MTLPRAELSNPNLQEDSRGVGAGEVDVDGRPVFPGGRQLAAPATALGWCCRSKPGPTVGTVVGSVRAGHGQCLWGFGGDRRGWPGIGGGGDCDLRTRTEPAAPGPARRLTMPATRLLVPADCRVGDGMGRSDDATGQAEALEEARASSHPAPSARRVQLARGELRARLAQSMVAVYGVARLRARL